eukprot:1716331-Prymnesium_polylepis.1
MPPVVSDGNAPHGQLGRKKQCHRVELRLGRRDVDVDAEAGERVRNAPSATNDLFILRSLRLLVIRDGA